MGVVLSSARDPLTLSLVSVAKTDLGGKNLEEVFGQEEQHEEVKKKDNRGGKVAQSVGAIPGTKYYHCKATFALVALSTVRERLPSVRLKEDVQMLCSYLNFTQLVWLQHKV